MGSIMLIICVMVVAMAGFASRVQANYHVSYAILVGDRKDFVACPSNYYNCYCYWSRERSGYLSQRPPSLTGFFTITNLCGYKKLDHYHNSDGTYSVFVAGGNGKAVAKCYGTDKGKETLRCPLGKGVDNALVVYDHLICYGKPCQPDR